MKEGMARQACLKKWNMRCRASFSDVEFGSTFTARWMSAISSSETRLPPLSGRRPLSLAVLLRLLVMVR